MIETGITVTVYADIDYRYEVSVEDTIELKYVENGREETISIGFGSVAEMEAVAKAMLKVAQVKKEFA